MNSERKSTQCPDCGALGKSWWTKHRGYFYRCPEKHEWDKPKKATGWRPIETAPKDGEEFLAYRHDAGVFTAWWETDCDDADEVMWTARGEDLTGDHPTHWMPFPKPPRATK